MRHSVSNREDFALFSRHEHCLANSSHHFVSLELLSGKTGIPPAQDSSSIVSVATGHKK
jgi:hypothetical protein